MLQSKAGLLYCGQQWSMHRHVLAAFCTLQYVILLEEQLMKKAAFIIFLVLLVAGGIGYFIAAPFLVLNNIRQGFEERNAEKIARHIDFPTLRQSLKEQVGAAALAAANKPTQDDSFNTAFAALAPGFIGGLIDSYVTPSGLEQFVQAQANTTLSNTSTGLDVDPQKLLSDVSYGFESLDRFAVRVPNKDTGREVIVILIRSGLTWKLSEIDIPAEALN